MSENTFYSMVRGQDEDSIIEALERAKLDAVVDPQGDWTIIATENPIALRELGLGPVLHFESYGQDPGCPWSLELVGGVRWSSEAPNIENATALAQIIGCDPSEFDVKAGPWTLGKSSGLPMWPLLDAHLGLPKGVNRARDLD